MGVIYTTFPLEDELKEYLDEMDIEYPGTESCSKNPSPNEVLAALTSLDSLNVESGFMNGSWQTTVEDEVRDYYTSIHMHECGKMDDNGSLSFEKGEPRLIIEILKILSEKTGTVALFPDTGDVPLCVYPAIDVDLALSTWEHTAVFDSNNDW
jgi:hypothetical protein